MKKLSLSVAVLTFFAMTTALSLPVVADDNNGDPTISDPVSLQNKNPYLGGRPKAPSNQQVWCTPINGYLYFSFVFPEGECVLYLTDGMTGETVTSTFDSETCEPVYTGYHSTAEIILNTSAGNTYCGAW